MVQPFFCEEISSHKVLLIYALLLAWTPFCIFRLMNLFINKKNTSAILTTVIVVIINLDTKLGYFCSSINKC